MTAQHPHSIAARWLAAIAVALTLVFGLSLAGGAARPAAADASQWVVSQPHWSGQSNGWRRHTQWRHHRHHFNNGFHGCFGNCGLRPRIVFNGGGVFFSSPGLIVNPGFIVRQPGFIVRQPGFIVRQPGFVVRRHPNLIFERPAFAAQQRAFIKRHPSLQLGQPMRHKPRFIHPGFIQPGGVRIITPGMN
jgi:hypothetical protein